MSVVLGCIAPHPPLIVPGIGYDQDKEIVRKTINAMEELTPLLAASKPDTAISCSPHSFYTDPSQMGISFAPVSEGNMHEWGTREPAYSAENDLELVKLIQQESESVKIPLKKLADKKYDLDHGVLVPVQFLGKALQGIPLVPVTFSYMPLSSHFAFGQAIARAADKSGKRVAFIASGDLSHYLKGSHYGYHSEGEVFESKLEQALADGDNDSILNMDRTLIERAGECGLRSIVIMLGAIDGLEIKTSILSHEGPFGVGYLIASFEVK
jgi:AmmeMemoRadiSam system protein B